MKKEESVNLLITQEDIKEAKKLQDDPMKILTLVDYIYMGYENIEDIPS